MKEYIVETRSLKKYYQMGENTVKALDGVDFRVKDQEFVAIIGKSGSGKSTLLHMLGGLDVPTEGEVLVEGKCLLGLKKEQLAIFRRRKIGFIFQNYNLVPDLNVYENVILPVELDGRKVDVEYVDGILELLGLSEKREALPGTLSGGQQQRAAIARALASKPAIILADEPISSRSRNSSRTCASIWSKSADSPVGPDRLVLCLLVFCLLVFCCVGFSNVGKPDIGFSDDGEFGTGAGRFSIRSFCGSSKTS